MSNFCSKNSETITELNYTDIFSPSCLPNAGAGWSSDSVDANSGLVSSVAIDTQIAKLLSRTYTSTNERGIQIETNVQAPSLIQTSTNHPQTNINPAGIFSKNSAMLRSTIESEYCFYYKRYIYILTEIFQTASQRNSNDLTADTGYQQKKVNTEKINMKLNQILQVLQGLANSRITTLSQYYGTNSGVNQVNAELDRNRSDLIRHSHMLKNSKMEKEVRSAMIDYTIEKNSSSRNLLAIYGFLNIVAVGVLFYIYRSSKK